MSGFDEDIFFKLGLKKNDPVAKKKEAIISYLEDAAIKNIKPTEFSDVPMVNTIDGEYLLTPANANSDLLSLAEYYQISPSELYVYHRNTNTWMTLQQAIDSMSMNTETVNRYGMSYEEMNNSSQENSGIQTIADSYAFFTNNTQDYFSELLEIIQVKAERGEHDLVILDPGAGTGKVFTDLQMLFSRSEDVSINKYRQELLKKFTPKQRHDIAGIRAFLQDYAITVRYIGITDAYANQKLLKENWKINDNVSKITGVLVAFTYTPKQRLRKVLEAYRIRHVDFVFSRAFEMYLDPDTYKVLLEDISDVLDGVYVGTVPYGPLTDRYSQVIQKLFLQSTIQWFSRQVGGENKYVRVRTPYKNSELSRDFGWKDIFPRLPNVLPVSRMQSLIQYVRTIPMVKYFKSEKDGGCIAYSPLVVRVYAATFGSNADEVFGDVCPWYLRAPVREITDSIREAAGKTVRAEVRLLKKLISLEELTRLAYYMFTHFGRHTRLPDPEVINYSAHSCLRQTCEQGCLSGYSCDQKKGCCTMNVGYSDTICDATGKVEIERGVSDDQYFFSPRKERACDAQGCVNGKCVAYLKDSSSLPSCDDNESTTGMYSEVWNYNVVTACSSGRGTFGFSFGTPQSKWNEYICSDDGSRIITKAGKEIFTCAYGSVCAKVNTSVNCFMPGQLAQWGICAKGITLTNGFYCTDDGPRCEPGKRLPATAENPCERRCHDDGRTAEVASPLRCNPLVSNYSDRICQVGPNGQSSVYEVNPITNSSALLFSCPTSSCVKGMCSSKSNSSCTIDGSYAMRDDGKCLMKCSNKIWKDTADCGHISIESYNNKGIYQIHLAMSKLPEFLLSDMNLIIRQDYTTRVEGMENFVFKNDYSDTVGLSYNRNLIVLADMTPIPGDIVTPEFYILHEYFHNWAIANLNTLSPPMASKSKFISTVADSIYGINHPLAPADYISITKCDKESEELKAIRPYGNTSCTEDFADHAAYYMTDGCQLLQKSKDRYDYFKNRIFRGKEYVDVATCHVENTQQPFKGSITPTPAGSTTPDPDGKG